MRRIFYFLATNAAILLVVSVIVQFLPPEYSNEQGTFMVFALVAGLGSSVVSLLMSKSMAKRAKLVSACLKLEYFRLLI